MTKAMHRYAHTLVTLSTVELFHPAFMFCSAEHVRQLTLTARAERLSIMYFNSTLAVEEPFYTSQGWYQQEGLLHVPISWPAELAV